MPGVALSFTPLLSVAPDALRRIDTVLTPDSELDGSVVVTDAGGRASVDLATSASFRLRSEKDGWHVLGATRVLASPPAQLEVLLFREIVVHGTVYDPDGKVLPGAAVSLFEAAYGEEGRRRNVLSRWRTKADAQGRYRLVLDASLLGPASITAMAPDLAPAVLPFGPDWRGGAIDLVLGRGISFEVRFLGKDRRPFAGVRAKVQQARWVGCLEGEVNETLPGPMYGLRFAGKVVPDAEGRAVVRGWPADQPAYLQAICKVGTCVEFGFPTTPAMGGMLAPWVEFNPAQGGVYELFFEADRRLPLVVSGKVDPSLLARSREIRASVELDESAARGFQLTWKVDGSFEGRFDLPDEVFEEPERYRTFKLRFRLPDGEVARRGPYRFRVDYEIKALRLP